MTLAHQVYAEFAKQFTLWRRRPIWAIIGVFAPLGMSVFIIAAFASVSALPAWDIGLVDEDNTVESHALVEAITAEEGTVPYFDAATADVEEAERLFRRGELYMAVVIPEGFGASLNEGYPLPLQAMVSNAHDDLSKNLRLGLDARLYLFYEEYMLPAGDAPGVVYSYALTYPTEVERSAYMGVGALMLTVILAAMMYAGLFAALEHEEHTFTEVGMRPGGPFAGMVGTVLAVLAEMLIVLCVVGVVNWLLWGLTMPTVGGFFSVLAAVVLLGTVFALVGYGLGSKAKDVRLVLAPTMLTVLVFWGGSGGFNPTEAWAGAELLALLPSSAAMRIMTSALVGLETSSLAYNYIILGAWAIAVIAMAVVLKAGVVSRVRSAVLRRERRGV